MPTESLSTWLPELAEEKKSVEGSVSGRIVLGSGCRVAGNRAGRVLGPGLRGLGIALRGRVFSLPFLVMFYFPPFFLSINISRYRK